MFLEEMGKTCNDVVIYLADMKMLFQLDYIQYNDGYFWLLQIKFFDSWLTFLWEKSLGNLQEMFPKGSVKFLSVELF